MRIKVGYLFLKNVLYDINPMGIGQDLTCTRAGRKSVENTTASGANFFEIMSQS